MSNNSGFWLTCFEVEALNAIRKSDHCIFDRVNDMATRQEDGLPERSEDFYDALLALECTHKPALIEEIGECSGRYFLTHYGWLAVKELNR